MSKLRWLEVITVRHHTRKEGNRMMEFQTTDTAPPRLQFLNDRGQWEDVPTVYESREFRS